MLSTTVVMVYSFFSLSSGGVIKVMHASKSTIHSREPLMDSLIFVTCYSTRVSIYVWASRIYL
jgi:hypothetical protein